MSVALKEIYNREVIPALMKEFGYKNRMAVPSVHKVIINMGIGAEARNQAVVEKHAQELTQIAGQKAVVTKAKKSVSNFKIRKGMPVGAMVTLRGERMYNFLYKLFNISLPKVRDFRGTNPNAFDGRGNYAMGLTEQLVFPEISPEDVTRTQGMHIVIVTTAKTDREARALLEKMGMPFRRNV